MSPSALPLSRTSIAFSPRRSPRCDPELAAAIGRELGRQREHDRADRVGEHRLARGARGAGLGADQQIRRGLSRPALLRRLRIRRRGRAARDRSRQAAVRLRLRQCPAAFRLAGQPGGVLGLLKPGDTLHGHDPRRRRASDPRRAASTFRANGSAPCTTACGATIGASITTRSSALRACRAAQADHRRRLGLSAHHRLRRASARSPTRSAPI